ncbi:MAG: hypothetical protein GTO12_27610 [Proteobacteria bacterium]|nr:hypothetical protein [Pseudomonadota bacterium]
MSTLALEEQGGPQHVTSENPVHRRSIESGLELSVFASILAILPREG